MRSIEKEGIGGRLVDAGAELFWYVEHETTNMTST